MLTLNGEAHILIACISLDPQLSNWQCPRPWRLLICNGAVINVSLIIGGKPVSLPNVHVLEDESTTFLQLAKAAFDPKHTTLQPYQSWELRLKFCNPKEQELIASSLLNLSVHSYFASRRSKSQSEPSDVVYIIRTVRTPEQQTQSVPVPNAFSLLMATSAQRRLPDSLPAATGEVNANSDYCFGCWHLSCLDEPLDEAPAGTWLCLDCEAGGHRQATEEALGYHSRWVLSKFPGFRKAFWGQLSYSSHATLAIKYEDGEGYDSVSVQQVKGEQQLVGHNDVQLQPKGVEVAREVLQKFEKKDWLVKAD